MPPWSPILDVPTLRNVGALPVTAYPAGGASVAPTPNTLALRSSTGALEATAFNNGATGDLALQAANVNRIKILGSGGTAGFVGIGPNITPQTLVHVEQTVAVTSPTAVLSVWGAGASGNFVGLALINKDATSRNTCIQMGSQTAQWFIITDPAGTGLQKFKIADEVPALTRFQIDAAGRISFGNNDPNTGAALDMQSTTAGLAIPRLTQAQETTLVALPPTTQIQVFNTELGAGAYRWWNGSSFQTIDSLAVTGVKTAAYSANFNEFVPCNVTSVGSFVLLLPLITAASKGSRVVAAVVTCTAVGGATPQNLTCTCSGTNQINGGPNTGSVIVSGKSTIVLESDGISNWIVVTEPVTPSTPATLTGGDHTLTRLGKVTRVAAPATLGADALYTFSNTGALAGDLFYVSLPTHDAHTLAVRDATTAVLTTWANTVANGGLFMFTGAQWEALMPGASST